MNSHAYPTYSYTDNVNTNVDKTFPAIKVTKNVEPDLWNEKSQEDGWTHDVTISTKTFIEAKSLAILLYHHWTLNPSK